MQYIEDIVQLKERAENIRLRMNNLAALAGVPPSTAHARHSDGTARDVRSSTLKKLTDAQIAEEIRLRDYLLALHPVETTPVTDRLGGAAAEPPKGEMGGRT